MFKPLPLISTLFAAGLIAGCADKAPIVPKPSTSAAISAPRPAAPPPRVGVSTFNPRAPEATFTPSRPQTSAAGSTCADPAGFNRRYDRSFRPEQFDHALFDRAILELTNSRRCAAGLAPFAPDNGLRGTSAMHSDDMARLDFYSHTSPVPGRTNLADRLNVAGVPHRGAAENIAIHPFLRIESGRPMIVVDRQSCNFTYDGKRITPHTYASLARTFVSKWLESPAHSANLLNPQYKRVGTGARFKRNDETCGDFLVTQNFAG